jgi:hypothetical protein
MLMNRTFFLACAMLGIAAASSAPAYARPCSDLDSDRERTACYVRSAIYHAEAAASEALAKSKRSRDGSTAKSTRDSKTTKSMTSTAKTNAASSPATCGLKKEYDNGVVTFRDTCTGEWAQAGM